MKKLLLPLVTAMCLNVHAGSEPAQTKDINISTDYLSNQIDTIPSVNLTESHPQKDGSHTYLLKAHTMLGVRSDNIFAYVTPISSRISGIESFTNIESHHCKSFMDVVKSNMKPYGLTEMPSEEGAEVEMQSITARSKDGSTVMFAECATTEDKHQFISVLYHMPTQHLLNTENNKIVTSQQAKSSTKESATEKAEQ